MTDKFIRMIITTCIVHAVMVICVYYTGNDVFWLGTAAVPVAYMMQIIYGIFKSEVHYHSRG